MHAYGGHSPKRCILLAILWALFYSLLLVLCHTVVSSGSKQIVPFADLVNVSLINLCLVPGGRHVDSERDDRSWRVTYAFCILPSPHILSHAGDCYRAPTRRYTTHPRGELIWSYISKTLPSSTSGAVFLQADSDDICQCAFVGGELSIMSFVSSPLWKTFGLLCWSFSWRKICRSWPDHACTGLLYLQTTVLVAVLASGLRRNWSMD